MIIKHCLQCEKELKLYPSQIKNGQGKFCSQVCKGKYEGGGRRGEYSKERYKKVQASLQEQLKDKFPPLFDKDFLEYHYLHEQFSLKELSEEIGCSVQAVQNALKRFEISTRDLKSSKNTDRYLDKYRGEKNWAWRGGYDWNRGSDWGKQRRKTRKRDNNTCQCCGTTSKEVGKNLDVHHIIPYRISKSNDLENLITLCPNCHIKADWEFRKLEEEFGNDVTNCISYGGKNGYKKTGISVG